MASADTGGFGIRWELRKVGSLDRVLQLEMTAARRSLCTPYTLVGAKGFYPST